MIDKYINRLLIESTPEHPLWNQEMIRQGRKPYWNYIDGCMMTAFLTLYEDTNNMRYLTFVDDFIGYFIEGDGTIKTYNVDEYNLDNINEGRSLFKLYDYTGKKKYINAIENLMYQVKNQPRTNENNFWHKKIYPNQVWLDGIYMALPFYLEYEKRYNNKKNYPDILKQLENVVQIMKDKKTGLYYHAYDSSKESFWCAKNSGLSANFWLRAEGWFLMSLVDILEILDDKNDNMYLFVLNTLEDLVLSLIRFQDESGMWFQVVDKVRKPDNYLETSGSSIISYAILKAVNLNILDTKYKTYGEKAFHGISKKYLYEKNGEMNLGGTCLVAGLGGKEKRDGSYNYYISEPIVENEAKGIAPFILAYINL